MKISNFAVLAAGAALLASCATGPQDPRSEALRMMQRDFKTQGIASIDRLKQDELQAACDKYGDNPPTEIATKLQNAQYAAIRWPADGKFLGDWKAGEKIAQNGRGMAWNDKGGVAGSCYNCHQIAPATTSFGTIGPSLKQFAKLRGYGTDIQRYAYAKIYNSKSYSACSQMPRFGHSGALTEQQMKDITALLMDPASPVNR